jgi:hypothetical protein
MFTSCSNKSYNPPTSFTFEGSNNGTNWNILDTRLNQPSWNANEKRYYSFDNTTPYNYYRLNSTSWYAKENNINTPPAIDLLEMFDNVVNPPNVFVRSLIGGVAYIDSSGNASTTDQGLGAWPATNEWDTYIANSTLNGKIIAGDNNIWHWNVIGTWCKETPIRTWDVNTNRITRSMGISFVYVNENISTTVNPSIGFRPVLEYLETNSKSTTLWY